jgi:tetratricopeptide (TPR) repeat protein
VTGIHEVAQRLQLEVCVDRLLVHLFPNEAVRERPGRHRVLEDLIEDNPRLLTALLEDDRDAALRAWSACLPSHGNDIRLHHVLAVLYRERALAGVAGGGALGDLLVFATMLWALLLGTKAFWTTLGDRVVDKETSLRETVIRELLTLQVTAASRWLVGGATESARPHVRCLVTCQAGARPLVRSLDSLGLPYRHTVDDRLLGQVSAIASELLHGWCADAVRVAQKSVDDPEVIARLPEGVRKNYEGGIRHLEPFARMGVPVAQVLRTGLEWYYEWAYSLYSRQELAAIRELTASAQVFADQLVPICVKGRGHLPDNQALSKYFMIRGFADDDPDARMSDLKEAIAWDPSNSNAKELLVDIGIGVAIEQADAGKFAQAHKTLDSIEPLATGMDDVRTCRSVTYARHAEKLADDGRFREAKTLLDKALKLSPDDPQLHEFALQLTDLVKEEANLRHLRAANEAMESEDYDRAINSASQVASSSRFASNADNIRVGALFRRAIKAFEEKRFNAAATELRKLLDGKLAATERSTIRRQLAVVLNTQAVGLVDGVNRDGKHFGEALTQVMAEAQRRINRDSFMGRPFIPSSYGGGCAACDESSDESSLLSSFLNRPNLLPRLREQALEALGSLGGSARESVVHDVLVKARRPGGFQPGGVVRFWNSYTGYLCTSCHNRLKSIPSAVATARKLLREAIQLDPRNKIFRKNLGAIDDMDDQL